MAHNNPSRREGKCLIACFQEKLGVQGADGKLSLEGALLSIAPMEQADPVIHGTVKAATEKCVAKVSGEGDTDRCEIGTKMGACFSSELIAAGLDQDTFM